MSIMLIDKKLLAGLARGMYVTHHLGVLLFWPLGKASPGQKVFTLNKSAPMQVVSRQADHVDFLIECGSLAGQFIDDNVIVVSILQN